ncbi:MAG: hypothetical protein K6F87_04905 [Lachnospiraceae bacterium]|nr:hypothetical protein [Lachnospiraceae bacterium]
MRFNIKFDDDINTFEKFKSQLDPYSMLPGNDSGITNDEFDRLIDAVCRIESYYHDHFEFDPYKDDTSSKDICVIRFLFSGRSSSNGEAIDDYLDADEDFDYAMTCHMKHVLKGFINSEIKDNEIKKRFDVYFDELEKRLDTLASKLPAKDRMQHRKSLCQTVNIMNYASDNSKTIDEYGSYDAKHKTILIDWPRLCLMAKVRAKKFGLDEYTVKWRGFEETLAHEMFHYFHHCCFDNFIPDKGIFKRHIKECLAEYFAKCFIRDTYNEEFCSMFDRNPNTFTPDVDSAEDPFNRQSDGGYSGAVILTDNGMWKSNMTDDQEEFYEMLFNSISSEDVAEEACYELMNLRDSMYE